MTNISTKRRSSGYQVRAWTAPRLTRLEAGRAELSAGPRSDGPNVS